VLKVKVDSRKVEGALDTMRRQMPYATSVAINECLKKAQVAQRAHQRSAFDVRNTRFMDLSVKIKPFAKKTKPEGVIWTDPPGGASRADVVMQHERGGTKKPIDGPHIAVPVNIRRGARGVPYNLRPRRLGFQKTVKGTSVAVGEVGTLLIRSKGGKGVIVQRRGGTGKRADLKVLYALVPKVTIKPRLKFYTNVWASFRANWRGEFTKALTNAIKTARAVGT
jgi:hypothetical protein